VRSRATDCNHVIAEEIDAEPKTIEKIANTVDETLTILGNFTKHSGTNW
jgi:hypothetical protein